MESKPHTHTHTNSPIRTADTHSIVCGGGGGAGAVLNSHAVVSHNQSSKRAVKRLPPVDCVRHTCVVSHCDLTGLTETRLTFRSISDLDQFVRRRTRKFIHSDNWIQNVNIERRAAAGLTVLLRSRNAHVRVCVCSGEMLEIGIS